MIRMWPCKSCKNYSTNPEGCLRHAPQRPGQTFEEELLEALTRPLPDDGILISGMSFSPEVDEPTEH